MKFQPRGDMAGSVYPSGLVFAHVNEETERSTNVRIDGEQARVLLGNRRAALKVAVANVKMIRGEGNRKGAHSPCSHDMRLLLPHDRQSVLDDPLT